MADMVARIRIVLEVPFSYDIPEPQLQPVRIVEEGARQSGEEMVNENQRNMARIDAAKHAETDLINKLRSALNGQGTVISELVEEVREREIT